MLNINKNPMGGVNKSFISSLNHKLSISKSIKFVIATVAVLCISGGDVFAGGDSKTCEAGCQKAQLPHYCYSECLKTGDINLNAKAPATKTTATETSISTDRIETKSGCESKCAGKKNAISCKNQCRFRK